MVKGGQGGGLGARSPRSRRAARPAHSAAGLSTPPRTTKPPQRNLPQTLPQTTLQQLPTKETRTPGPTTHRLDGVALRLQQGRGGPLPHDRAQLLVGAQGLFWGGEGVPICKGVGRACAPGPAPPPAAAPRCRHARQRANTRAPHAESGRGRLVPPPTSLSSSPLHSPPPLPPPPPTSLSSSCPTNPQSAENPSSASAISGLWLSSL